MQLVDANVLLYATNERAARHEVSHAWLDEALAGAEAVGFSWTVLLAFLRLSTKAGVFDRPLRIDDAASQVEDWLGAAPAVVAAPTVRHLAILRGLLAPLGTGGNLTNDAHLAALAVEHDARLVSFDSDFDRFPGVRWARPGG